MARLTNADALRFKLNLSEPSWVSTGFHGMDAFQTRSVLRLCPGTLEFRFLNTVKQMCWITSDEVTHYSFKC